MSNFFELKKQRAHAMDKADATLKSAEDAKRELTASEQQDVDMCMTTASALTARIKVIESKNTLIPLFNRMGGVALLSQEGTSGSPRLLKSPGRVLSHDYVEAFYSNLASKGTQPSAVLYEGSDGAGGYAVPLIVDSQIVPLAPTDMGVREVATVIPTVMDIKIPRATTISTAAAKAEGDGTGSNVFTESEPVLDQFTLSAFMAGLSHIISWELAQDVPSFQSFAVGDMLLAQSIFEENWFVNGTGNGQAQGLIGNTGVGVTGVAAGSDSYASELLDATFDVMGTLKTAYHPGASWLMSRAASIILRKAQKTANLFEPVFVRVGKQDFLHGYPVAYSTAMPTVAAGHTPLLMGDFRQGYVIGDRGGSGINVKILDQPRATEGLVVLLVYRRIDGRIRRSEAIQAITLA